jgi:hypothetical protein
MKYRLIMGLLCALLVACRTKELLPSEYVSWMKDPANGLREEKTIGEYTFHLQYKTPEFVVLQQYKSDNVAQMMVESELEKYAGMEYYTFEISAQDGHDLLDEKYYEAEKIASRIEYFLSYAQDNFTLVTDNDTIACSLFHFERSYSLSPITTLVLGFDRVVTDEDRTLVYDDQLLGCGPVRITINAEDISNVPAIKYTRHE